jgi:hypothetical protein
VSALLVALVALLLLGWGLVEVSRSVARAPDQNLVDELTSKRTRLTPIAHGLSWAGSSFVIALWTVFFVVLYQRRRVDALTVALSSAGAAVIFDIGKLLVGRPRPSVRHLELSKRAGGSRSPRGADDLCRHGTRGALSSRLGRRGRDIPLSVPLPR